MGARPSGLPRPTGPMGGHGRNVRRPGACDVDEGLFAADRQVGAGHARYDSDNPARRIRSWGRSCDVGGPYGSPRRRRTRDIERSQRCRRNTTTAGTTPHRADVSVVASGPRHPTFPSCLLRQAGQVCPWRDRRARIVLKREPPAILAQGATSGRRAAVEAGGTLRVHRTIRCTASDALWSRRQ